MVDTNQRKSGIDGRLRRLEGGFAAGDGVCILKKHQLRQLAQRFDVSFSTELANSGHPRNVYGGPVLIQTAQSDVVRGSHQQSRGDWHRVAILIDFRATSGNAVKSL